MIIVASRETHEAFGQAVPVGHEETEPVEPRGLWYGDEAFGLSAPRRRLVWYAMDTGHQLRPDCERKFQVASLMNLLRADQNREDCSAVPGLGGDASTVGRIIPPYPGPHRVR
jgi:hypothetical protein